MPRSESELPTELELEILKVLWRESPLPVRDVRARLEADAGRPLAHSSVITMLNIMHRKGFLKRRKAGNAFLFSPKGEKKSVIGRMMVLACVPVTYMLRGHPQKSAVAEATVSEPGGSEPAAGGER